MSKDYSKISHHFQDLFIADLLSFFSFIVSHPLYFAYLLFFLPYIVQLFSFLSPLLLSTSVLLLSLLTISPHFDRPARYGFLEDACRKVVNALETPLDDNVEFYLFEPLASMASELEACIALETATYTEVLEDPAIEGSQEKSLLLVHEILSQYQSSINMVFQNPSHKTREENDGFGACKTGDAWEHSDLKSSIMASVRVTNNVGENSTKVQQNDGRVGSMQPLQLTNINVQEKPIRVPQQDDKLEASENQEFNIPSLGSLSCKRGTGSVASQEPTCNVEESAVGVPQGRPEWRAYEHQEAKNLRVGSFRYERETRRIVPQESTCKVGDSHDQVGDTNGKDNCNVMSLNLGGFGSMRKEKEWNRTLACKLYEERQSVDGGEGMDLLWESYEVDSGKGKTKNKEKTVQKKDADIEEEEEEEEEEMGSQLCCLQALRFSTGRMNLGMKKLNSLKISKALKGMGLFVKRERKFF